MDLLLLSLLICFLTAYMSMFAALLDGWLFRGTWNVGGNFIVVMGYAATLMTETTRQVNPFAQVWFLLTRPPGTVDPLGLLLLSVILLVLAAATWVLLTGLQRNSR